MADRQWNDYERRMIRLLVDTFDAEFVTPRMGKTCSVADCKRPAWINDEWYVDFCQQHWRKRRQR